MESGSPAKPPLGILTQVYDAPFNPICRPPEGLFVPVPIGAPGGPTKAQAAGPSWRWVARNRYVPVDVNPGVPEQRVLEAAARLPGEGRLGAVTGWGGLRLAGGAYFDGLERDGRTRRPVPLVTGSRRSTSLDELSYEPLTAQEVTTRCGVPVTEPVRSLFYEMRRPGDWREAVVAMDMAAAAELVSIRQLAEHHARHTSWRRATRVARALPFCSERSRSPSETRLRLVWVVDAGLPPPLVNCEVFDRNGRLICVADLFDEEAGLVVEYDGAEHRKARRHTRDVVREEGCRRVGLEYCKVTGGDMHRREVVVDRLLATRGRARFLAPAARAWTLEHPPGWWRDAEPLHDRLERRAWIRDQFAARGVVLPEGR